MSRADAAALAVEAGRRIDLVDAPMVRASTDHVRLAQCPTQIATLDGTISGWTEVVDPTRALLAVESPSAGAVYKGLALATDPAGQSFLYAADFGHGRIDVFNKDFSHARHFARGSVAGGTGAYAGSTGYLQGRGSIKLDPDFTPHPNLTYRIFLR